MLKATKVRIYPTDEQAVFLNQQFGAVRFVYNRALAIKNHYYKHYGRNLSPLRDLKPLLAIAKKSRKYAWLKDSDSIALQEAVRHLNTAFKNFFDKKHPAGFPKFKLRHGRQSSYHCTSVSVGVDWIRIPKCEPIKARVHRVIEGEVKSITLSRTVIGKYYASVLTDDGQEPAKPIGHLDSHQVLGVDMGLTHLAITSDGRKVANQRFLKNAAGNLRRKQKALSRTKKGSRGRAKARLLLAKAHERVANARNDFQHKLSKQLIDENQAVVVETLKVKNMLKNRKLSKHIADASWSRFIAMLEYKAKQSGKHLVKIDQWFASSKTCHVCLTKLENLSLNIRHWECPDCHVNHDRDINAAMNIWQQGIIKLKAAGLTVSANGGCVNPVQAPVAACEVGSLVR